MTLLFAMFLIYTYILMTCHRAVYVLQKKTTRILVNLAYDTFSPRERKKNREE